MPPSLIMVYRASVGCIDKGCLLAQFGVNVRSKILEEQDCFEQSTKERCFSLILFSTFLFTKVALHLSPDDAPACAPHSPMC